ncbi:MAG: TetR/AcrR family transcriptional regulator [Deltaproteobacteria bacterium]|nr:TetR/AcrR family transcriptional regulator [Deltaproteobacteria bacterium]
MTQKKSPALRREEIFEAALVCFNEKGFHKTSIDDIAQKTGITKGGVYYHFKSKKNLFIQLFNIKVNDYFTRVTTPVADNKNAAEYIQHLVQRSEKIFHKNADILRFCLEFIWMSTRDQELRSVVTAFYKQRVSSFAEIIREGMKSDMFRDVEPDTVARILYFLSMGSFLTYFTTDLDFDIIDQHADNITTLYDGIAKTKQAT